MTTRLLIALVIGLASTQATAAPKDGGAKPSTGWLQVESAGADADVVARLYREQLLGWYRNSGTMDEAELALLADADYFAFRPDLTSFSIDQGESAGQWTFDPPQQGRWPTNAVQVIDRSDASTYRIVARVHCDPAAASCRKLRTTTAAMSPPEPATADESASYAAWGQLIEHEACTPAPKSMAAPRYPASLARGGEGGSVELRLLVNPCGEVRAVRLSGSSGQPLLDQSAIDVAWGWRIQSERQPKGAMVRVPVDFVPPQLDAASTGRIDRSSR